MNTKKTLVLFLLSLLIPIVSFSQTIYPKILNDSLIVITPTQLKQTNLIFSEHSYYIKLVPQLQSKIINLQNINNIWEQSDSLQKEKINTCIQVINNNNTTINNLNNTINKNKRKIRNLRNWTIGGFGLSSVLIAILLLN